jgi:hypothetical protein
MASEPIRDPVKGRLLTPTSHYASVMDSKQRASASTTNEFIHGIRAIANAVWHETDVRVRELPIKIENLLT